MSAAARQSAPRPGAVATRVAGAQLQVLYLNTPFYDFLTATLLEGLNQLEADGRVRVVAREASNYAPRGRVWPRDKILRERRGFDAVILGTNKEVDTELFEAMPEIPLRLCVDGADEPGFAHDPSRFHAYFKRELRPEDWRPGVHPCPFAIERRWWRPVARRRPILLSACMTRRDGERARTLDFLEALDAPDLVVGPVAPGLLTGPLGVLRRQCTLRTWWRQPFAVGHNRRYQRVLRRSRLSLCVPGVGFDTGRWWEILGSGAVLVSREPEILMPHPFEPGEHYLRYRSLEELEEILARARREPGRLEALRERAVTHAGRHHTTRERARHVLDVVTHP